MRTNIKPENRRLLEALDYLDESVISGVLADVSVPESGAPEVGKRSVKRSMKYVLALAACLVLLGTVMPMLSYLMGSYPEWFGLAGAGPTGENDEYILTEGDLASINAAWIERRGTIFAPTIESAMRRTANDGHYFGKYGETIVILINSSEQVGKYCTLGGHEFKFISGWLCFFNGGKVYDHEEIADTDILTDSQINAIYKYYKNKYLISDFENELSYWEFIPTLEPLTEEEMRAASDAVAKYRSEIEYEREYPFGLIIGDAEDYAKRAAQYSLERDRDIMFRGNVHYERYYGTVGGCIIMATKSIETWQHENTVEGIVIDDNVTFTPFAYLDGEALELKDAYEAGWLTLDDIVTISSRHQLYEAQLKPTEYLLSGSYLDPIEELEPLSTERVDGINAAWDALYPDFDGALINPDKLNRGMNYRYLGTIGGRVIIWRSEGEGVEVTKKIGGFEFSHTSSFDIIVCFENEFHYLGETDPGVINDAILGMIYSRNEEYEKYYAVHNNLAEEPYLGELKIVDPQSPSPFKLSYEEQYEIIWNFIKDDEDETKLKYTYSVRCFMKSDGAYAVMLDGPWVYTQALRSVDVAGYKLLFNDGQRMYIYKDGAFYTLREAYEYGVVNEEFIASIIFNKAK